MNPDNIDHAKSITNTLNKTNSSLEIILVPPTIYLSAINDLISPKNDFKLGAQNCSIYNNIGPFTGEVSAHMLKNLGCEYVIIGHSERRALFNETNDIVLDKLMQAVSAGLTPILCVGESLEIYETDETIGYLNSQLKGMQIEILEKSIIAYEPIWAIGTGLIPTNKQITAAIEFIKSIVKVPVLYGGSVNQLNIKELTKIEVCDGFLVGGASLNPVEFNFIISEI
jgi:triosephosphate isomerase